MQLISDMFGKWDTIYIWELLVLSFKKSSILTIWGFFQLFLAILQMVQVWPENYSSYFGCFHIHAQYLFYRIFSTILYKNINSNCEPLFGYFLLASMLYELNIFKLSNVFHTCPEAYALSVSDAFYYFTVRKDKV